MTGSMKGSISVVPLAQEAIPQIVTIHLRAFPNFFLSFLGPTFLREFYGSFLVDPQGLGFMAKAPDGQVLGAVVGPTDPRGYFKRLLFRRWWAFALPSMAAVMRRPSVAPRIARAFVYRGDVPTGPPRALLSSIAVLPEAQGRGVGKALIEHWLEEVRSRGVLGAFLTTDAIGNEAVNAFYLGTGWRVAGSYSTPEGRRMNRYEKDLTP